MMMAITTSIISSSIMLVLGFFMNKNLKKIDNKEENKQVMIGASLTALKLLLWSELKRTFDKCEIGGFCSWEERERITKVYEQYHALGGNGNGTDLYNKLMSFPTHKQNK